MQVEFENETTTSKVCNIKLQSLPTKIECAMFRNILTLQPSDTDAQPLPFNLSITLPQEKTT